MKFIAFALLLSCIVPCIAQERQIKVPLSLEDQVAIIPTLCEQAMLGYRAQLQTFCDGIKAKLTEALLAAKEAEIVELRKQVESK